MGPEQYDNLRRRLFEVFWTDIEPLVEEMEESEEIPHDRVWSLLREAGGLGLLVPRGYGGAELTATQYLPIIAELAKVHGGVRAAFHVHTSFAHAVAELGTESQCEELLPGVVRGERSIAFALTEPDYGTGLDLGTTAHRDGDDFVIDGRKWLITNSDFASDFIVLARSSSDRANPLSAILVPRGAPGFRIEALPETMGCKGGQHGLLTFDGVRVSASRVLGGQEGQGEHQLEATLELSRLLVAASSWGTAERALELARERATERVTFGKPIGQRQAIQRYLAEMAMDVYALRTMLEDAAAKYDAGERIPGEAAMCKLFGLEAVGRVTDRALLVFGGIGYTRKHPIEMLYRDARLNWLEEGTPTIQHLSIARSLDAGYQYRPFGQPSLAPPILAAGL